MSSDSGSSTIFAAGRVPRSSADRRASRIEILARSTCQRGAAGGAGAVGDAGPKRRIRFKRRLVPSQASTSRPCSATRSTCTRRAARSSETPPIASRGSRIQSLAEPAAAMPRSVTSALAPSTRSCSFGCSSKRYGASRASRPPVNAKAGGFVKRACRKAATVAARRSLIRISPCEAIGCSDRRPCQAMRSPSGVRAASEKPPPRAPVVKSRRSSSVGANCSVKSPGWERSS